MSNKISIEDLKNNLPEGIDPVMFEKMIKNQIKHQEENKDKTLDELKKDLHDSLKFPIIPPSIDDVFYIEDNKEK